MNPIAEAMREFVDMVESHPCAHESCGDVTVRVYRALLFAEFCSEAMPAEAFAALFKKFEDYVAATVADIDAEAAARGSAGQGSGGEKR